MINAVVDYINSKLDFNVNYGLCEKVIVTEEDNEFSLVKPLGENGDKIDFDKLDSLSYILPDGTGDTEELDDENDVGCVIVQRINYPVRLVVYKRRCELPEIDEIYKVIQDVAVNNLRSLINSVKAYQGVKIAATAFNHNKNEVWETDWVNVPFKIGLDKVFFSVNLNIQIDLDLSCDNITVC